MRSSHRHPRKILISLCLMAALSIPGCTGHLASKPDPNIRKVVFYFEGQAQTVCLTGDFNQWTHDTHCLKARRGRWSIQLKLPRGPLHYAFIVDGRHWVMDPKALYVENDGFGKQNSVIVVE
ncbi:MAG: isoamylase early set domain-containing protein [Desulfobacteraceae bacterium]|nr:isoamylase early set domain-containing protein [Desulfobacteraceae bacterium]